MEKEQAPLVRPVVLCSDSINRQTGDFVVGMDYWEQLVLQVVAPSLGCTCQTWFWCVLARTDSQL